MNRVDSIETARTAATSALRAIAPIVDDALFEIVGYASALDAAAMNLNKRAASRGVSETMTAELAAKAAALAAEAAEISAAADDLREIARAGA